MKFTKLPSEFGVRSKTEWEFVHEGREYKLSKHGGQWWLYQPSVAFTPYPTWNTVAVRDKAGIRCSLGTRITDAKHNAKIFLTESQGPDHENWRD